MFDPLHVLMALYIVFMTCPVLTNVKVLTPSKIEKYLFGWVIKLFEEFKFAVYSLYGPCIFDVCRMKWRVK